MHTSDQAIHALRNNLTAILCYAELAQHGDLEAQDLLMKELQLRLPEIYEDLDSLGELENKLRAGRPERSPAGIFPPPLSRLWSK